MAVISQFIREMTFNDELERRKAIYLAGNYIPLSEVSFDQALDPKAVFPRSYNAQDLPEKTRAAAAEASPGVKFILKQRGIIK